MSVGTLIFLLLIVGSFVAMFSMHRGGGHAHGGMGGCGGGHGHSHGGGNADEEEPASSHTGHQEHGDKNKPLLGPPGTQSGETASAPAQGHRHRGC